VLEVILSVSWTLFQTINERASGDPHGDRWFDRQTLGAPGERVHLSFARMCEPLDGV
jgi:hypothetical protein